MEQEEGDRTCVEEFNFKDSRKTKEQNIRIKAGFTNSDRCKLEGQMHINSYDISDI